MNKFLQASLEVNDICFKYYFGVYLALLSLDIWKEDFVFSVLRFPLGWLMWFVILSGILKFFFNLEKIISWVRHSSFRYSEKVLLFLFFSKELRDYLYYLIQRFINGINSIFSYSLVFYLILLLVEQFQDTEFIQEILFPEKSPIKWFLDGRMGWLLGWVILTGIISVLTGKEKEEKEAKEEIVFKDYLFIFGLGILGAFLIFYKTKELGWLSYVISAISGLLIILLSIIILREEDEI